MTISSLSSSQSSYYFHPIPDAVPSVVDADATSIDAAPTVAVDAALTLAVDAADAVSVVDAVSARYLIPGLSTIDATQMVDAVPIFIPPPPTLPHDTLLLSAQTSIDGSTFDYGLEIVQVETCPGALSSIEVIHNLIEGVNIDGSFSAYPLLTKTDSSNNIEIPSTFTPSSSSESSSSLDDSSSSKMIATPIAVEQPAKKKGIRFSEALKKKISEIMGDQIDENTRKKAFEVVQKHFKARGKDIDQDSFNLHLDNILFGKRRSKRNIKEYTLDEFELYMSKRQRARGRPKTKIISTRFSWQDSKRIVDLFHAIIKRAKPASTVVWESEAFDIMNQEQAFKDKQISLPEFAEYWDSLRQAARESKERINIDGYQYGCIRWVQGQEEECQGEYLLLNLEFNTRGLIKKTRKAEIKSSELRKRKDSPETSKSPLETSKDMNKRHCSE